MKSPELSIERQINRLIQAKSSNKIALFTTSQEHKAILARVVNHLAQKHLDLHFELFHGIEYPDNFPSLVIAHHINNHEDFSYTWVERSELTGKHLVMAKPPGAYDSRCITVWEERSKALEIAGKIFKPILKMSLQDWQLQRGGFKKLLDSLPDDEDETFTVPLSWAESHIEKIKHCHLLIDPN